MFIVNSSGDQTVVRLHVKACCIEFPSSIYIVLVFSIRKIILKKVGTCCCALAKWLFYLNVFSSIIILFYY